MQLPGRRSRPRWWRLWPIPFVLALAVGGACATSMPGKSYEGRTSLGPEHVPLRDALRADVEQLAGRIGERNTQYPLALREAAQAIEQRLSSLGYAVRSQPYEISRGGGAIPVRNLEVERKGTRRPQELVIVGAHYDSAPGAPGADDNGSGVAALLALAARFARAEPARTIRFVAFVNEEPPFFHTDQMGSLVYARELKSRRERVVAMYSLESLGYFSDAPGSQHYPAPLNLLYPSAGSFVGFVGNVGSMGLVRRAVRDFREVASVASEGAALPGFVIGVGWSDQWSFWREGYPALMVTDTAVFRNPNYHTPDDKPGTLDYDRLALAVVGLEHVIEREANR